MITKEVLNEYVRIMSGCDVDPNLTLVDFSFNEKQRNVVNLVNNEAKTDKKDSSYGRKNIYHGRKFYKKTKTACCI